MWVCVPFPYHSTKGHLHYDFIFLQEKSLWKLYYTMVDWLVPSWLVRQTWRRRLKIRPSTRQISLLSKTTCWIQPLTLMISLIDLCVCVLYVCVWLIIKRTACQTCVAFSHTAMVKFVQVWLVRHANMLVLLHNFLDIHEVPLEKRKWCVVLVSMISIFCHRSSKSWGHHGWPSFYARWIHALYKWSVSYEWCKIQFGFGPLCVCMCVCVCLCLCVCVCVWMCELLQNLREASKLG